MTRLTIAKILLVAPERRGTFVSVDPAEANQHRRIRA